VLIDLITDLTVSKIRKQMTPTIILGCQIRVCFFQYGGKEAKRQHGTHVKPHAEITKTGTYTHCS
jgi:hypothetical protein